MDKETSFKDEIACLLQERHDPISCLIHRDFIRLLEEFTEAIRESGVGANFARSEDHRSLDHFELTIWPAYRPGYIKKLMTFSFSSAKGMCGNVASESDTQFLDPVLLESVVALKAWLVRLVSNSSFIYEIEKVRQMQGEDVVAQVEMEGSDIWTRPFAVIVPAATQQTIFGWQPNDIEVFVPPGKTVINSSLHTGHISSAGIVREIKEFVRTLRVQMGDQVKDIRDGSIVDLTAKQVLRLSLT